MTTRFCPKCKQEVDLKEWILFKDEEKNKGRVCKKCYFAEGHEEKLKKDKIPSTKKQQFSYYKKESFNPSSLYFEVAIKREINTVYEGYRGSCSCCGRKATGSLKFYKYCDLKTRELLGVLCSTCFVPINANCGNEDFKRMQDNFERIIENKKTKLSKKDLYNIIKEEYPQIKLRKQPQGEKDED